MAAMFIVAFFNIITCCCRSKFLDINNQHIGLKQKQGLYQGSAINQALIYREYISYLLCFKLLLVIWKWVYTQFW